MPRPQVTAKTACAAAATAEGGGAGTAGEAGGGARPPELDEAARVEAAYARRQDPGIDRRYGPGNPVHTWMHAERDRALAAVLRLEGLADLADREILDVGCGAGQELEALTRWGAERSRLHGIDLLESRIAAGRERAPDLDLRQGDARELPWPDETFDLLVSFTVLTSVISPSVRGAMAWEMRRVLRPGGAILWYDFSFNNPFNKDVRKVTRDDLEQLFPGSRLHLRRVTLAPPLARAIYPVLPGVARVLAATELLSTHLAGVIRPELPLSTQRGARSTWRGARSA